MSNKIGLVEAMSIGVGGMVGGGIFAVLGLAVSLAGGGTPVAFLIAGMIALITSYSYSKLSLVYPDKGGTVKFVNQGFGRGTFSGGVNNLLWVSYIIMLSLYASAFASYAPNLVTIVSRSVDYHIYATAIILIATGINYYSIKVVGRIESYAVGIKLLILVAFIFLGIYGLFGNANVGQLNISNWESPLNLVAAGMVIFVAYEGFELIANSSPDVEDPHRNLPRAYYFSVLFVMLLYVIIAIVTVGSLDFEVISEAEDYVLAEAAKPMLGKAGFTIMTIAALISTFSAINASLYGGSRVNYEIAEDDELPHELTAKLWNQPVGLLITSVATLVVSNLLELESISTAGSMGFLIVFATVNFTGYKLADRIKSNKWIPVVGLLICLGALAVMLNRQWGSNRQGVIISIGLVCICFMAEWVFKRAEGRRHG